MRLYVLARDWLLLLVVRRGQRSFLVLVVGGEVPEVSGDVLVFRLEMANDGEAVNLAVDAATLALAHGQLKETVVLQTQSHI